MASCAALGGVRSSLVTTGRLSCGAQDTKALIVSAAARHAVVNPVQALRIFRTVLLLFFIASNLLSMLPVSHETVAAFSSRCHQAVNITAAVVPAPGAEVKDSAAPWLCAIWKHSARPSPAPPCSRLRALSGL